MTFEQIHTGKKKYLFKIFTTDLFLISTTFCAELYPPSLSTLVSIVNKLSVPVQPLPVMSINCQRKIHTVN